jgi:hypothetical protein
MNRLPETTTTRPRTVTHHLAAFFRDLVRLGELQSQLFVVDLQDCRTQVFSSLALLAAGVVVALCCVPVALFGLAWLLAENTPLTIGQSCLVSALSGALLAVAAIAGGRVLWRRSANPLSRSRAELAQNVAWVKTALERLCDGRQVSDEARETDGDQPPF